MKQVPLARFTGQAPGLAVKAPRVDARDKTARQGGQLATAKQKATPAEERQEIFPIEKKTRIE